MLPNAAIITKPTMAGMAHGSIAAITKAVADPPPLFAVMTLMINNTTITPSAPITSRNLSIATPIP